jgi:hypothetical protein
LNQASPIDFCNRHEIRAHRERELLTREMRFHAFLLPVSGEPAGCERCGTDAPERCSRCEQRRLTPRRRLPHRSKMSSQRCVLRRKRPTHSPSEHPVVVNRSVL